MRKILPLIATAFFAVDLFAADIEPQQALDIASQFVQHDKTAQANIRRAPSGVKASPEIVHRMPSRIAQNKDNVYIVNLGNDQGFVVVSGETGASTQILGYCDHGSFDYENAPIQFQDLLNEYSAGIDSLRQNPALARPQMPAHVQALPLYMGKVVVEPLLTTTWNQTEPYNSLCPNKCYTGCVPTAVTQVMNYWKWPKESKGQVHVGWSQEEGNIFEDFSGHVYDWDNMLDLYGISHSQNTFGYYGAYNSVQAHAVAYLMADVGKAMRTNYCQPNGSPTPFSSDALIENFGYELGIQMVNGTTAADVRDVLKAELDARRPVLYAGYPKEGDGHALVCDGYTENNYFHFNYGWGGQTDGFYRLSSIPIYVNNVQVMTNVRPYDAVEKEIGNLKYGLLANGTADILQFLGGGMSAQNGTLIIPDSVTDEETGKTYTVTHMRKRSFFQVGHFTKVVMGNNIKAIDPFTFIYATIDTLVLSDKMEIVPDEAFQVTNIKHLTIGENVKFIGKKAFMLCPLNTIICKSRQVELDTESFAHTTPGHGDWEEGIIKINKKAFYGAEMSADTYFKNLEVLEDSAISDARWGKGSPSFRLGPKVREIAPSALDGMSSSYVPVLIVSKDNPYYSTDGNPIIYNKDKSRVIIALCDPSSDIWPETVIKMEPSCVRSGESFIIPPTIVDMEGAFKDITAMNQYAEVICSHLTPPVISDATFRDEIFAKIVNGEYNYLTLRVPEGTEELYAEAPGWRKFRYISPMYTTFEPLPPQDLAYRMKVDGDSLHIAAAVAQVNSMGMTEDENGHPLVTLRVDGRENVTIPAERIDSISFAPGFIYENAEIFTLNDSNLTVHAQKCTITFDATTFDDSVQICVRNSVLLPRPTEGVTSGIGIDISMLTDSGLVHNLSGVARISIPFEVSSDERVAAAYYNEENGEWEPVYMEYDREKGEATIMTDHLSFYSLVRLINERTKSELFEILTQFEVIYAFNEATKLLLDVLSSDDPKVQEVLQFKSDMGLWQSLGLDGFYSGVSSIAEPLFNFKPEAISNAMDIMGEIGTAMTILDVVRADLIGDNIGVASNTLKVLMAKTAGAAASYIGTPVMAASMSLVAFIGVALEKFGTMVSERKVDLFREAYRYYYSTAGYRALAPESYFNNDNNGKAKPHGYFRTTKDWYDYFFPAFMKADMTEERLNAYIEQSVRVYCDQFWNDNQNVRTWAYEWARTQGLSTLMWETEELRNQISEEYYAELMNGTLVSVFAALRNYHVIQGHKRVTAKVSNMQKFMNGRVAFRVVDSERKEDEVSKFAGRRIGFAMLPEDVADKDKWQKEISAEGKANIGWFTTYALVRNMIPFQITLFDENGLPEKSFDFQLDGRSKQTIIDIDLATQGVKVETNPIKDLELSYEPRYVLMYASGFNYQDQPTEQAIGEVIYLHDTLNFYYKDYNKARFSTEVERFFNRNNFITVDSLDNYSIGDSISGKFVGDSASGQFTIHTDYKFFIKTLQQFVDTWNNPKYDYGDRMRMLLRGSMKHQIACQYTIKRRVVEDHYEYDITYSGEGAFDLTALHVNHFNKVVDWMGVIDEEFDKLTINDVGTGIDSEGGDVTLKYKVTLR